MQTLKPCPFCNGPAEIAEDCGSFFARCVNSACPPAPQTPLVDDADTAASDWNTRPAAPVEGLETVRWEVFTRDNWHSDHPQSWATRKQEGRKVRELVTRPQAEAIIAGKDAEIARLRDILDITERNELREAENNAALTARVKELEGEVFHTAELGITWKQMCGQYDKECQHHQERSEIAEARFKELEEVNAKLCDDVIDYELKIAERDVSLKAIETQLAAAKKALEDIAIYPHDETHHCLDIARAALEAKP